MINIEKYTELLIYIINYVGARMLGKTKLYKILFFVDWESIKRYGTSITNDKYFKYPMGPVPENAWSLISTLKRDNTISVEMDISENQKFMYLFKANREAIPNVFSSKEIELIVKVVDECSSKTRVELVEESHQGPWKMVGDWEEIILKKSDTLEGKRLKYEKDFAKSVVERYSGDIEILSSE